VGHNGDIRGDEMITSRRSFLVGLGALIAAPAIVRAELIMPVKQMLILPPKISDVLPPIEGYARVAGLYMSNDSAKLADYGSKGWEFTEHEFNGDYRPSRAIVIGRNGEQLQRRPYGIVT
jgi:hypothetical protein